MQAARLTGIVATLLVTTQACSSSQEDEPLGAASAPIIGAEDNPEGYPGVLVARRPRAKGDSNFPADKRDFVATAAVFSRDCVITATHVAQQEGVDLAGGLRFFHGGDAEHDGDKRFAPKKDAPVFKAKAIVHVFASSKPDSAPDFGQPEIAIVSVSDKFPDEPKFTSFTLGTANPAKGAKVTVTGYGLGNPWAAPAERASRRARVELVTNLVFDAATAYRVGDDADPATKGVAPGDSGCPITSDGLVGILSRGYPFSPTKAFPNAGNGIVASVPYAFSKLTPEDRKKIDEACNTKLVPVTVPIDDATTVACTEEPSEDCDAGADWDDLGWIEAESAL